MAQTQQLCLCCSLGSDFIAAYPLQMKPKPATRLTMIIDLAFHGSSFQAFCPYAKRCQPTVWELPNRAWKAWTLARRMLSHASCPALPDSQQPCGHAVTHLWSLAFERCACSSAKFIRREPKPKKAPAAVQSHAKHKGYRILMAVRP